MNSHSWMLIDIETLGVNLDAPIFAVSILTSHGGEVNVRLDLDGQLRKDAIVDSATVAFWLRQAPCAWLDDFQQMSAKELLGTIRKLYLPDMDVWTRGNDFDIPILGRYFKRHRLGRMDHAWHPWPYYRLHNVRTAEALTGKNPFHRKSHNPSSDVQDDMWIVQHWYALIDEHHSASSTSSTISTTSTSDTSSSAKQPARSERVDHA